MECPVSRAPAVLFVLVAAVFSPLAFAQSEVSPEVATTEAEPEPVEAIAETAKEDKMICRNERVTGSTIPKRVCLSESQRAAMADEARRVQSSSTRKTANRTGG